MSMTIARDPHEFVLPKTKRRKRVSNRPEPAAPRASVPVNADLSAGFASTIKARRILQEAAEKYDTSTADVLSQSRRLPAVRARQEAAYRIYHMLKWSFSRIGRFLNRDHSTIIFAINAHKQRIDAGVVDVIQRWRKNDHGDLVLRKGCDIRKETRDFQIKAVKILLEAKADLEEIRTKLRIKRREANKLIEAVKSGKA